MMKPIGVLMIEHRLIEKFLLLVQDEIEQIEERLDSDKAFLKTTVDFIRTYADEIHHGKEEDILFEQLKDKPLNEDEARIMAELNEEHVVSRGKVSQLVQAEAAYFNGERTQIDVIKQTLTFIVNFYPVHIAKEDKDFFKQTQRYFSSAELEQMMEAFNAFDSGMDKERYNKLYEKMKADLQK